MTSYKTIATPYAHAFGPERFIVMRKEVIGDAIKKILGYEDRNAVKENYFMEESFSPADKMEMVEDEIRKNVSLGLEFTGNNLLINHHEQITWSDESILKFLDTNYKMIGFDIGCNNPTYKNKCGIPVGLYRLQMLSVCLSRSDMMGMTKYRGEVINKWVKKNKTKFIGKCKGSLTKDEYETLCGNAYVYVNKFFENDMDENYEMNKYCLEQMTEEEIDKQIDRCDNMLWFWRGEF